MRYAAREMILDIDKSDSGNHLAVVDYVTDIYKFYKAAENKCRPRGDYMDSQVDINSRMRVILVDWLVEMHRKYELMAETLYLTVYIIDRYLSLQPVRRKELQLVGVTALLIACKYEERTWAPEVHDLVLITDHSSSREQILRMEKSILNSLQWNLAVPTPYAFLVRFIKASSCSDLKNDKEMENMVFFFAELALLQYALVASRPSKVAAAAVYAARITLKKVPLWTDTLKHHTGYTESELLDRAKLPVTAHSTAPKSKYKEVYQKYSSSEMGGVALRPPAIGICTLNADFFDAYDSLLRTVAAIPESFFFKPSKSSPFSFIKKEETMGRDQSGKRGWGQDQLKGHQITSPLTKRLRR